MGLHELTKKLDESGVVCWKDMEKEMDGIIRQYLSEKAKEIKDKTYLKYDPLTDKTDIQIADIESIFGLHTEPEYPNDKETQEWMNAPMGKPETKPEEGKWPCIHINYLWNSFGKSLVTDKDSCPWCLSTSKPVEKSLATKFYEWLQTHDYDTDVAGEELYKIAYDHFSKREV